MYSHVQYQSEDEMPNRLGIFHVRSEHVNDVKITEEEIDKINTEREKKLKSLLEKPVEMQDEEAVKLGNVKRGFPELSWGQNNSTYSKITTYFQYHLMFRNKTRGR